MKSLSRGNIKSGMWKKCNKCSQIIYSTDLQENYNVCPKCGYHFRLSAYKRIDYIIDKGSFTELFKDIYTKNVLNFKGYDEKIEKIKKTTSMSEAIVTGVGNIGGIKTAIGVMDSHFMMGSMGTVVGEKITRTVEYAKENNLPLILFCASGGARMQEGILSLMQMAKVSSEIMRFKTNGGIYISVLTDPTTGGVTASFAMEGYIILSEPHALVGFAGKKVAENTVKEQLSEDLQSAEYLFKTGLIDNIVERSNLKKVLFDILDVNEGICYEERNL